MVRAPCCEKIGLKRGPWTIEEDRILMNYISVYGHNNWRALPKQAGLLRCGKSCRLRWINYLRPDIKRGNFSKEEEETIGKLHGMLGNRWSAIAARLPGRTDNEIKNVWHTHLKKKLINKQNQPETKPPPLPPLQSIQLRDEEPQPMSNYPCRLKMQESPQHSATTYTSSSSSSATANGFTSSTDAAYADAVCLNHDGLMNNFHEMDENFWAEVFSSENSGVMDDFQVCPLHLGVEDFYGYDSNMQGPDGMDLWTNLFSTAAEIPQPPVGF